MKIIKKSNAGLQSLPLDAMLLTQRIIFLNGTITTESVFSIIQQLLFLEIEDKCEPIKLVINSLGGSVSAGISVIILLQAESTLEAIYKEEASVIRANCSCYCYFPGGMDDRSAEIISKKFGWPYEDILYAPMGKVFVMCAGHKPIHIPRFNTLESKGYQEYLEVNGLDAKDKLK